MKTLVVGNNNLEPLMGILKAFLLENAQRDKIGCIGKQKIKLHIVDCSYEPNECPNETQRNTITIELEKQLHVY